MKLKVMTTENKATGDVTLPIQFSESVREDIITRAVLALQSARRQAYGVFARAGLQHAADLSRRRRKYRGSYGKGISRVPRKILSRRGSQMHMVGAEAPGTIGGRRAHGPKAEKKWAQKINKTENRKAIRAALSATVNADIITARGHKIPEGFPFIIDDSFESIQKTAELEKVLVQLGFADELARASQKRIRAGIGKLRGRKYKSPVSFLFVTGKDDQPIEKAAGNLPGTEVATVNAVNAELLAPGTRPGRLTLYTKSAIERLEKEGLFTKDYKGVKAEKPAPVKPVKKVAKKVAKTPKKVSKKVPKKAVKPAKK